MAPSNAPAGPAVTEACFLGLASPTLLDLWTRLIGPSPD